MNKPEWIRKMLRRRGGPDDKMKRSFNISIYDIDRLNEIQNIANREGISVSHIIANLLDYLSENMESPQRTIDQFATEHGMPPLNTSEAAWIKYLKTLKTDKEWQDVEDFIIMLDCLFERSKTQRKGRIHADMTQWSLDALAKARERQNEPGAGWN